MEVGGGGGKGHTPSIAFRYFHPKEGCRKPVLGVWLQAMVYGILQTPSTGLRHPSFKDTWKKVPESDARSLGLCYFATALRPVS